MTRRLQDMTDETLLDTARFAASAYRHAPGIARPDAVADLLDELVRRFTLGGVDLTLARLSATNRARCARWHHDYPGAGQGEWTVAHWSNAVCGEAGELANVAKKLERLRFMGAVSARDAAKLGTDDPESARGQLLAMLMDEVADVVLYADLVLGDFGLSLADAIRTKFNLVSEAEGYPERLP